MSPANGPLPPRNIGRLPAAVVASLVAIATPAARAETGVTADEIRIGIVNPTSGPAAVVGANYNPGAIAALERTNRGGGVNGRRIRAIFYDDAYEPAKTIEMTRKLLDVDQVFALMNFGGTPTTKAVLPEVLRRDIPFLFPRTGDSAFRDPPLRDVINIRPSNEDEIDFLVDYLVKQRGLKRIAVLKAYDAYGASIHLAASKALGKRGLKLAAEGEVKRNSEDVREGFEKIAAADPEAVILAVGSGPGPEFIKLAYARGKHWIFGTASASATIQNKLSGAAAESLIVPTFTPPADGDSSLAREFREDLKAVHQETRVNATALEGYLNARVLEAALKQAGPDLTRERLRKAFEGTRYEIAGLTLDFTGKGRASPPLHLVQMRDGKPVQIY